VQSGVTVNADTAFNIGAVFDAVTLVAGTLGSLPLVTYRRTANGKQRAYNMPLYQILHDRPNRWQTRIEFIEMLTGHAMLRGNGYAVILSGPRGPVDQLVPLNPERMMVTISTDGTLRYQYRELNGQTTTYLEDEIFHLRGYSSDGYTGVSVLTHARETFGLAIAAEGFAARLFSQGASPRGVLEHPGTLGEGGPEKLRQAWNAAHAGLDHAHGVVVLEEGMKWHQVGMTPEDSQMLESRRFQISEVARWFHVPPHKLQEMSQATFSNIEQQNWEFVADAVRPWAIRWELSILKSLILASDTYFAEFLMDAYLRGDTLSRYNAYNIAINAGWMSPNEARERENMNTDSALDYYRIPLNTAVVKPDGDPSIPIVPANPSLVNQALAEEVAARIIRKEIAAIDKADRRHINDRAAFSKWCHEFYSTHAAYVIQQLHIKPEQAERYAHEQCEAVVWGGRVVTETWLIDKVKHLAQMATEVNSA
jgi:HK97 family phage portal protein